MSTPVIGCGLHSYPTTGRLCLPYPFFKKGQSPVNTQYSPKDVELTCKPMNEGFTLLTWRWTPNCLFPSKNYQCPYTVKDIDGYRVYQISPGTDPAMVMEIADPNRRLYRISPGNVYSAGPLMILPQYVVRAYKGSQESDDSNPVNGIPPKYVVTLPAAKLWQNRLRQFEGEGLFCENSLGPKHTEENLSPQASPFAGWGYNTVEGKDGCTYLDSHIDDIHVAFDLSQIKGPVTGAILRWKWAGLSFAGDGATYLGKLCKITLADQNETIMYGPRPGYPNPLANNEDGYNVTHMVRAWVNGLPNKGFSLLSDRRQLIWNQPPPYSQEANTCLIRAGNFELEVSTDQP